MTITSTTPYYIPQAGQVRLVERKTRERFQHYADRADSFLRETRASRVAEGRKLPTIMVPTNSIVPDATHEELRRYPYTLIAGHPVLYYRDGIGQSRKAVAADTRQIMGIPVPEYAKGNIRKAVLRELGHI